MQRAHGKRQPPRGWIACPGRPVGCVAVPDLAAGPACRPTVTGHGGAVPLMLTFLPAQRPPLAASRLLLLWRGGESVSAGCSLELTSGREYPESRVFSLAAALPWVCAWITGCSCSKSLSALFIRLKKTQIIRDLM